MVKKHSLWVKDNKKRKTLQGNYRTITRSIITFFSALFFLSLYGFSQEEKVIQANNNAWFMYFGNHKISKKYQLHTEYQWRRNEWVENWQQSLFRIGVDRILENNALISAGYGWIKSYPYGVQPAKEPSNEHRIWQQLILNNQVGRFYFNHRYRLEERFVKSISAERSSFSSRGRYRLFVTLPLSNNRLVDNTVFLGVYNEVFLGFGKNIGNNILDQNRLYFALGYRFNKEINVQLGYLNHYVVKSNASSHERNHTLQLALTYNIDFTLKD